MAARVGDWSRHLAVTGLRQRPLAVPNSSAGPPLATIQDRRAVAIR